MERCDGTMRWSDAVERCGGAMRYVSIRYVCASFVASYGVCPLCPPCGARTDIRVYAKVEMNLGQRYMDCRIRA